MTLERVVRSLVARVLPATVAADAAEDLLEDYRRMREARGHLIAALFLLRESISVTASCVVTSLAHLVRSLVLVRRDAMHALRAVSRRPWSTFSAMLMLGAGLAAVAAAAGLASTLLFRPISSRYPGEVKRLASADAAGRPRLAFSEMELARVRENAAGVASIATANLQPVVLRAGDTNIQTLAEVIGGRYFDLVGLDVAVGRPLLEGDAAPGAPPIIVISNRLWRDRFGGDAAALGTPIRLNGRAFTIVGVTAGESTSSILSGSVDAWVTLAHADAMLDRNWRTNPDNRWWTTLVRVAPGSDGQFAAALERATQDLGTRLPEAWRERTLITVPGTVITGRQRDAAITLSTVLTAFAFLILGAAAANVSGLFLAAAAADRGRAAIQLAIGSGRGAIVRRYLIEGAVLGGGGAVLALLLYGWIRRQLAEIAVLPTLSLRLDLPFGADVVAGMLGAGALTGMLIALGPAWWMTRLDLAQTLRDGAARTGGSAGLSKARRILVAAQVAISITLLAGATLFVRSMDALATLDVGFPRHGLIAMDFDLEPASPPAAMLPVLAAEALRRAQAVPGVIAAAMSNRAPVDSSTPIVAVSLPGSSGRPLPDVTFYLATERYFETVGVPILRGRAFTEIESTREDGVVIVNETLAALLWPDGDVLGRPLRLHPQDRTVSVVGVARNSKYRSLSEPARPHIYLPTPPAFSRTLLVRTQDDPRRTILAVQSALDLVGSGIVGFFPRTLDDHVAIDMLPTRAAARAAAVLGALALALSAAGLYGIVMWFVEVRRREIGVRVALGASANDVRRLVVRQAVMAATPGMVIGLLMAMALTIFGQSLFVGIGAVDPASLLLGIVTLSGIVLAASYLPSRRATQVDPVIVLRST